MDVKKDKKTFLFSFDHKKKYAAKNGNDCIFCGPNYGPYFGSDYPEIYINQTLDRGYSYDNAYENTFVSDRKLTNGEEYWDVKELEVHRIIYN